MLDSTHKKRKIVFVSGTRADFSKIKSLALKVEHSADFEVYIFATGMHLSNHFGLTVREIEKCGFKHIHKFINHDRYYQMDLALAHTIDGFAKFIAEYKPDLIIAHGDRIEPLAASIAGALNNILVAHIEGGEVSGTIDDSLRHAISKLSHIHLVNDCVAKRRLMQLGESEKSIFIIGSPDLDILDSSDISLEVAKKYYDIDFEKYAILLFHPVTTEIDSMQIQANVLCEALKESRQNYIVVYPNNDLGFEQILEAYKSLEHLAQFRFFPSIRFEYFIALLKGADFLIGNSSCALKEAPHLGIPSINVGTRQSNRAGLNLPSVINTKCQKEAILDAIRKVKNCHIEHSEISQKHNRDSSLRASTSRENDNLEVDSANCAIDSAVDSAPRHKSAEVFFDLLKRGVFWDQKLQKQFVDLEHLR
ncbi:UDP-N-acetylglucosamine 2-epimerase [Helicobacter sp. 23-1045]